MAAPSPQEQKQQNATDPSTAAEKKGEDSTQQQQQSLAVSERRVSRAIRFAGEVALHELN